MVGSPPRYNRPAYSCRVSKTTRLTTSKSSGLVFAARELGVKMAVFAPLAAGAAAQVADFIYPQRNLPDRNVFFRMVWNQVLSDRKGDRASRN